MKKTVLDNEEKDILTSYDRGEWRPVKNQEQEIKRLGEYAKNTLRKDKRINIRISSKDLDQAQAIAAEEGIPYQTRYPASFTNMCQAACLRKSGHDIL